MVKQITTWAMRKCWVFLVFTGHKGLLHNFQGRCLVVPPSQCPTLMLMFLLSTRMDDLISRNRFGCSFVDSPVLRLVGSLIIC